MLDDKQTFEGLLDQEYVVDPILNLILQFLAKDVNHFKDLTIADCTNINSRFYY